MGYEPIKGPTPRRPEEHRDAQAQVGSRTKDSQRTNTLSGPLPGLSQQSLGPVVQVWNPSPWVNGAALKMTFWMEARNHSLGVWDTLWDAGDRALWDSMRLIMGCLGEEEKVGKRKDQGGLRKNKHGKVEGHGDGRGWSCVNMWLVSVLVWPPSASDQCRLSPLLTRL